MSEYRDVLNRASRRVSMPEPAFEMLFQRRKRKQTLKRITAGVVALVIIVLFAVGVGATLHASGGDRSAGHRPTTGPSVVATEFSLPTSGWTPGASAYQARLDGVVKGEAQPGGGCVWVESGTANERVAVLWPLGFRARFNPDLEILDGANNVVARGGQTIRVGGGYFEVADGTPCMFGQVEPFYIQSSVEVVG